MTNGDGADDGAPEGQRVGRGRSVAGDADARADLVRAATELIAEDAVGLLAAGLRPDEVASRAGRSRRSFYAHFPDRRELVAAVAANLLGEADRPRASPALRARAADELAAHVDLVEGDLLQAVQALTDGTFRATLESERSTLVRRMWALAAGDATIEGLHRGYVQRSDDAVAAIIEAVNDRLGLRLREPWDADLVAVVVRALGDGMAMRHRVDPGSAEPELYGLAGLSLLSVLTQPIAEDPTPLIEHLQGFAREVAQGWSDQHDTGELTSGRDRIMAALRETVSEEGPAITLESVALRSGLSRQTIVAAFGSLEGLVDAAVRESMPDLDGEADFDLATSHLAVVDVVRRHLLRIADWASREPHLAALVVAAGADGSKGVGSPAARRFLSAASTPLARILTHFAGDRVEDPQLLWTAVTCTGALLSRATTGSQPAGQTVRWLTNMAVSMIAAPPIDTTEI